MDKAKGLVKGGWHPPGKDGGKESWRGDFKGINQVAGWVGKGKSSDQQAQEHHARPISSLKDPNTFGPPPKRLDYHGGGESPIVTSDSRGVGASLSTAESRPNEDTSGETQAAPPGLPFRTDTTGLSTKGLPKPPIRGQQQTSEPTSTNPASAKKLKPALPPRLPPRQNSGISSAISPPPPSYETATNAQPAGTVHLNQDAINRLGSAGVSVPGLGIGSEDVSNPWKDERSAANKIGSLSIGTSTPAGVQELHSRFSKKSSSSGQPDSPSQGTSLAQKQAALKTASAFRNDPSSVSLTDARNAASTAKSFQERHGDQVAAGWQSAAGLNKKYGIADKVNSYSNRDSSSHEDFPTSPGSPAVPSSPSLAARKKPAPPPPRKGTSGEGQSMKTPPPVPLSSKPRS
ncbi:hypothetical protein MMC20_006331 [Loxospora ochrophaea]|nr:hypothetical protein [Loxospora ochrophaea]